MDYPTLVDLRTLSIYSNIYFNQALRALEHRRQACKAEILYRLQQSLNFQTFFSSFGVKVGQSTVEELNWD